jgi:hypothetical protein
MSSGEHSGCNAELPSWIGDGRTKGRDLIYCVYLQWEDWLSPENSGTRSTDSSGPKGFSVPSQGFEKNQFCSLWSFAIELDDLVPGWKLSKEIVLLLPLPKWMFLRTSLQGSAPVITENKAF